MKLVYLLAYASLAAVLAWQAVVQSRPAPAARYCTPQTGVSQAK